VTALSLGRLPQLLTNAVTVELPPTDPEGDKTSWGPPGHSARRRPGARAMTFRQCASLSKTVNSTLLMFFAPSQIIKGKLLLDEYNKYQVWYNRLPDSLSTTENAPAHILCLQYIYSILLALMTLLTQQQHVLSCSRPAPLPPIPSR
jgi:hypothetical protein